MLRRRAGGLCPQLWQFCGSSALGLPDSIVAHYTPSGAKASNWTSANASYPTCVPSVLSSSTKNRLPAHLQRLINTSCWSLDEADPTAALQEKIVLVTLPQLSPNMKNGKIRRWLKQAGDEISTYDVIFEVDTDNLSEEGYKIGDFAGTVTMLVEAQEEGFLTNILVPEGELVDVHTPVAIMCEAEGAVKELAENQKLVHEIVSEQKESLKALTWQSYLKESSGPKGCC